ncbi:MAG: hypothetical protein Q4P13_05645 [Psychrobacter sp.]|nr:hypothetical protein [Psychrobacter sp.]
MTYSAPRQGLFAIIILISFCLQTLLLVLSTEQQLEKSREQKGEQMVAQLINESSLALQNRDRVSLSVIAGRYTSEADVARLVIKDAKEQDLVQLGNAPLHQGETIRQIATKGDAVIGSVALTLKDKSKGEIIANLWPFVIGSMLLHLFLWLLYGYVARPTRAQINALGKDIHDYYRLRYQPVPSNSRQSLDDEDFDDATNTANQGDQAQDRAEANQSAISKVLPLPTPHQQEADAANIDPDEVIEEPVAPKKRWSIFKKSQSTPAASELKPGAEVDDEVNTSPHMQADYTEVGNDSYDKTTAPDIHQELNAYVKSQQAQSEDQSQPQSDGQFNDPANDQTAKANVKPSASLPASLTADRRVEIVDVQIIYDDHYRLLDKLAPEAAEPYFTLCSQLLNQAINELLKQPLLYGISLHNSPKFNHSGALVVLKADNSHSKVALAGVMLGKLYLMLNQIIYDKHRELSRFALPVKVGVSDEMLSRPLGQLLESVGKRNEMIILYPKLGLKQIGNHIQLRNLARPTTVYERESAFFDGTNEAMMQRLIDVRNAVLLSGNSES